MFYYKNGLMLPGVYFLNPNYGATNNNSGMQGAPIFGSLSDFRTLRIDQTGEKIIVMPGFKLEIWGDFNYNGTAKTIDNTNGTKIIYGDGLRNGSSCKIYYLNTEITNVYSSTGL